VKRLQQTGGWGVFGFKSIDRRRQKSSATVCRAACEALESRLLFDVTPGGLTPQQMRHAYGADQISFGGISGNGSGQTIAIIVTGTHPTAYSDLQQFDSYYGLADPPSFHRYDQDGGTNYPTGSSGVEESLDIEWAHVMAPAASIDVIECPNDLSTMYDQGVVTARSLPGVSVVSISFQGWETSGDLGYDHDFTTPAGHGGVTFLNSSGDSGVDSGHTNYAGDSPNVIGVGGTVFDAIDSAGDYPGEVGWSGSGGGISTYEAQPSYQNGVVSSYSTTQRTTPDVSMDAGSGVAVYDTTDNPASSPWSSYIGGTSLATPMMAGLVAVADQGRAVAGLPSLDGPTQTLPRLYALPSSDFHDITSGNNSSSTYPGYSAGPGYDLVTGLGTPIANKLVNDLAFDAADFTVTNTNDSGTGSLRQAILNVDAYGQPATITFRIPRMDPGYNGAVFTIKPVTQLPAITDASVTIDGSTEQSYSGNSNAGRPEIFLDGSAAPTNTNGLTVTAQFDKIEYLGIDDFHGASFTGGGGIVLTGTSATQDFVIGCLIGVGSSGTSSAGNSIGVTVNSGANNDVIGTPTSGQQNVIGDNSIGAGILGASDIYVTDDIGVSATFAAVPNNTGIEVMGGSGLGSSTSNQIFGCVIGDNTTSGVLISGAGAENNVITSCLIGVTDVPSVGYYSAPNDDGILINLGASSNVIGGVESPEANVIAGNSGNGVEIDASASNTVEGNTIGEATRTLYNGHTLTTTNNPNAAAGVFVHDTATGNTIGGSASTDANVISANGAAGVLFGDAASTGNTVEYNYIGTDSSGDSIGNAHEGLLDFGNSETISDNVLSGNGYSGMSLPGNSNTVTGNLVGLNPAGTAAVPNAHPGVYINGFYNVINGNTISGNSESGVEIDTSSYNTVENNQIGTNPAGTVAIPNQQAGVLVTGTLNQISDDLISGNVTSGVALEGESNTVEGCLIGTDSTGSNAIPNIREGVYVDSSYNTVGGTTPAARNVISGNTGGNASFGVSLDTASATNNTVEGNYIGTNSAGTAALGNVDGVIVQEGASDNTIGSATAGGGNVISGNNYGIVIDAASSTTVLGNDIGTDSTGALPLGNGGLGITVDGAPTTIGGLGIGQGNTIDFNGGGGLEIDGTGDVSIMDSTVYDNTGSGGITNYATLSIYNSTVTGNSAGPDGSGIYNRGSLSVYNSTITLNSAELNGGGIDNVSGTVYLANTIVSKNGGGDIEGTVNSSSANNLIRNGDNLVGITNGTNGNQIGTDASPINPLLGALANNGGTTETLLPSAGSPAINAGSNSLVPVSLTTDQRGEPRIAFGTVDIGAVEVQPGTLAATTKLTKSTTGAIKYGQNVSFTATVAKTGGSTASPTGTVNFMDGANLLGTGALSGGVATFTTTTLPVGSNSITAVYGGDINFATSTSNALSQTVTQSATTTALTKSTTGAITFGQSVTLTVKLAAVSPGAGTPTGTVTFMDYSDILGSGTLSGGVATLTTSSLLAGTNSITASYGGDPNFTTSTSNTLTQTVKQAATTTKLTKNTTAAVKFGQQVTFTASVAPVSPGAGTPTGSFTFYDGANMMGTAVLAAGGIAVFTIGLPSVGSNSITAVYGGDTNFATSTSGALTQTVNQAATTAKLTKSTTAPITYGQSVTLTASIAAVSPGGGMPAGTVSFMDGSTVLGTAALSGGIATLTTTTIPAGSNSITAVYGGNADYTASTSGALSQTVNKSATTTKLTKNTTAPITSGTSVTSTATVAAVSPGAGIPANGDTVTFMDNGSSIGTAALSAGVATLITTTLPTGSNSITAVYGGDTDYTASTSNALSQTVDA